MKGYNRRGYTMTTHEDKRQQILDRYYFRHATKGFDPSRKISKEDFRVILETARLSPSSFGMEPWHFIVVESDKLRKLIKEHAWGARGKVMEASHFVLILARTHEDVRFDSRYLKEHYTKELNYPKEVVANMRDVIENFQKNDFQLFEDMRYLDDWSMKQTYIPLSNMMSVAAELGIDSCPIEGFNRSTFDQLLGEEQLYGDNMTLSVMVAFGYRKEPPREKKRRHLNDLITWA